MLIIRASQIVAFENVLRPKQATNFEAALRQLHPNECDKVGHEELAEMILEYLRRSHYLKISDSDQILLFCELALFLGQDFENEISWARSIFADESVSIGERLQSIYVRAVVAGVAA